MLRTKSANLDYIDPDVAYFLGLLVARGEISQTGSVRRITMEFPFKNLEVEGIRKSFNQKNQLIVGLQPTVQRIGELTESNVRQDQTEHSVILTVESLKDTMFWRNIRMHIKGKTSYYEFEIPEQVFQADVTVKKEFLRGYADVAGTARASNVDQVGRHRVYLDILNPNWHLPTRLCHLIQDHLDVPVQTITYGHPNLRDPEGKEYKAGRPDAWAREHQIKVYCENFTKIGFYMPHKQEILEELADYNRLNFKSRPNFCCPPKRKGGKKFKHPGEKSDKLPKELRGKHFTSYWNICATLGCWRYQRYMKTQTTL